MELVDSQDEANVPKFYSSYKVGILNVFLHAAELFQYIPNEAAVLGHFCLRSISMSLQVDSKINRPVQQAPSLAAPQQMDQNGQRSQDQHVTPRTKQVAT